MAEPSESGAFGPAEAEKEIKKGDGWHMTTKTMLASGLALILSIDASAAQGNFDDVRYWDSSKNAPEAQSCDDVCARFDQADKARIDHQWCADHGQSTDSMYMPRQNLTPLTDEQCPHPRFAGDGSCRTVQTKLFNCFAYKSDLAMRCRAYRQMKKASGSEKTVLYLDLAAVAACGAVCLLGPLSAMPGAAYACTAAGAVATIATWTEQKKLKSEFEQITSAIAGLGGTAASTWGAFAASRGSAAGAAAEGGTDAAGAAGSEGSKGPSAKKLACASAAFYGIMTGIRANSMNSQGKARKSTCKDIQERIAGMYNGTSFAPGGPNGESWNSGPGYYDNRYAQTGVGPGSAGGGTPTHGTSSLGADQSGTASDEEVRAELLKSTDGSALVNSGLDRLLKPMANHPNIQDLVRDALETGDVGRAVSGALNAAGAGGLSSSVGALAQDAATNPGKYGGSGNYENGVGGTAYAGGGGGAPSGRGGAGGGGNPFDLLGKQDSGGLGGGGTRNLAFEVQEDGDIWHSGTDLNIFQIVSGRIEKISPRLKRPF